jgi:hypothetical protein
MGGEGVPRTRASYVGILVRLSTPLQKHRSTANPKISLRIRTSRSRSKKRRSPSLLVLTMSAFHAHRKPRRRNLRKPAAANRRLCQRSSHRREPEIRVPRAAEGSIRARLHWTGIGRSRATAVSTIALQWVSERTRTVWLSHPATLQPSGSIRVQRGQTLQPMGDCRI